MVAMGMRANKKVEVPIIDTERPQINSNLSLYAPALRYPRPQRIPWIVARRIIVVLTRIDHPEMTVAFYNNSIHIIEWKHMDLYRSRLPLVGICRRSI